MQKTERFELRMDADTLATLLKLAKAREVSKSEVVREAVRNMAEQLTAQPAQPTKTTH